MHRMNDKYIIMLMQVLHNQRSLKSLRSVQISILEPKNYPRSSKS